MNQERKFDVEVEIQDMLPPGTYVFEVVKTGSVGLWKMTSVWAICEALKADDPALVGMSYHTFFSLRSSGAIRAARKTLEAMGASEAQLGLGSGPDDLVGLVFNADLVTTEAQDGVTYTRMENISKTERPA